MITYETICRDIAECIFEKINPKNNHIISDFQKYDNSNLSIQTKIILSNIIHINTYLKNQKTIHLYLDEFLNKHDLSIEYYVTTGFNAVLYYTLYLHDKQRIDIIVNEFIDKLFHQLYTYNMKKNILIGTLESTCTDDFFNTFKEIIHTSLNEKLINNNVQVKIEQRFDKLEFELFCLNKD